MIHTVKLTNLQSWDIRYLKKALRFFIKQGIKVTFLKKVVFIHCDTSKPYQCIFNIIWNYRDNLICNQKTMDWLTGYYPFELILKRNELTATL